MNGKFFIGQKALSLTEYEKTDPISGVILWVDDENFYEAGDETGTVIEQDCPYASQEMANNLLATLQGYTYQGLEANGAKVSPVAELGDGMTVGGLYTQLAYQNIRFSTGEVMDVATPGSDETPHEYKTEGETTKQFAHQIAQTRSEISKTAEEIGLRIDGLDDQFTELTVTLEGVTIKDESGQTLIKGSSIDTTTIKANSISADKLNLTGAITFGDLGSDVQNEINSAKETAQDAYDLANSIDLPSYIHRTYIDSTEIRSPTILAGEFYGNTFNVYPQEEEEGSFNLYGYISTGSMLQMLSISYAWESAANIHFGSPADAIAYWDFGTTRFDGDSIEFRPGTDVTFSGTVDFSGADVYGLSVESVEGRYVDIIADRDLTLSADNGDLVMSCNSGDLRISAADGQVRIYTDGTTWYLDRDGWHT